MSSADGEASADGERANAAAAEATEVGAAVAAASGSETSSVRDADGNDASAAEREGRHGEECRESAQAHAWLGPLHDVALDETRREGQYMAYSSCVQAKGDDEYCLGQLNNQLHLLHHAVAVSRALE